MATAALLHREGGAVGSHGSVTSPPASLHEHGRDAADPRAVAELGVAVLTPAVGRARGSDAAGVIGPGAHGGEGEPAKDERWAHSTGHGPVAELAQAVEAPAVGRAEGCDAAGVQRPRGHGDEAEPPRDRHRAHLT